MQPMKAIFATIICATALAACDQLQTEKAPAPEAASEAASDAVTASDAYVGTWAADASACTIPQEQEGAPYVFHSDGYNQHEAHCTWAMIEPTGPNAWRVAAACQVDGDEASLGWDMTVDGDTLQMVPGPRLTRCP